MRRRNTAFEVTLITVFVMTALLAAASWLAMRWQRAWLLEEARRGLLTAGDALEASLRHAMMRNQREEIRAAVERIAMQTRVREIRLAEHRGRIAVSTRSDDPGRRLEKNAPACALCHARGGARPPAQPGIRTRTVLEDGSLRAFTPVLAEPGCIHQACHAQEAASGVLGVMEIGLPLEELERGLRESRMWSLGLSSVSVLAGSAFVWLLLERRVRRPIRELLEGIRRVAAGNLDHRLTARAGDEFGELAETFNAMTGHLSAAQQRLIQSERLASMGRLAAGVAHEINNPLTGILSYAEDLLGAAAPDDPRRKDYEVILNEAMRCRRVVRGLLDFARQDPPRPEPVRPEDLIGRAVDVVARQAAFRNIRIERRIQPDLPPLTVDRVQIEQVLLNLIVNAQQAMPEGGRIVVGAARDAASGRVELTVEDQGPGIPDEIRERIFEPFFSTKGGKTDGLGLAVSLGIVQQHGGSIGVENKAGGGAVVRVILPLTKEDRGGDA